MAHTPGPFVAKKFGYEKYGIYDERGTDIGFAHRKWDATLFAAAPDLLAALKAIQKIGVLNPTNSLAVHKYIADMNAAIAKATGEK